MRDNGSRLMIAQSEEIQDAESHQSRCCLRDLVQLADLPAAWVGHSPQMIADGLGDALVHYLQPEWAYVALCDSPAAGEGAAPAEPFCVALRGNGPSASAADQLHDLHRILKAHVTARSSGEPVVIDNPLGDGELKVAIAPIGPEPSLGIAAAAASRADFPREEERLLLGVAAHYAAIALQNTQLVQALRESDRTKDRLLREIMQLNQTLEARVSQRTTELLEANRELEAFAYSVSHDLRAPLRHVSAFSDLLRSRVRTRDEVAARYARIVCQAADRAAALVEALLAFFRLGRAELRRTRVSMNELFREVRAELTADAAGRCIHWHIAELPAVRGDPLMLRLVVQNLLANAVKYTRPRSAARIEVRSSCADEQLVFTVRDNGVGFDPRAVDKLFGVFSRLHRQEEFEGLGIGLANVRRIIQRHGGRVSAEGSIDGGATFSFSLPRD
jgi:signal transduction histidine kinase